MATGALFVVLLFARRDRRRVDGHRIFDRSRRRMAMRAAFRVRRRMLMLLRMSRGKRDRHGTGEREYQDGIANRGWHVSLSYGSVSIIREFCPRPDVVQTAKSFGTPRDYGVNAGRFPQSFPQHSRKSFFTDR